MVLRMQVVLLQLANGLLDFLFAIFLQELNNMPSRTYQKRSCRPEEVAGIALFLSSEAAGHIIGHNLVGKLVPTAIL